MKTSEAVAKYGSRYALSKALGLTHQAVAQWGENVPPLRAYQLKEMEETK